MPIVTATIKADLKSKLQAYQSSGDNAVSLDELCQAVAETIGNAIKSGVVTVAVTTAPGTATGSIT